MFRGSGTAKQAMRRHWMAVALVLFLLVAAGEVPLSSGETSHAPLAERAGPSVAKLLLPDPVVYSAMGDSITPAYDANSSALNAGIQPYYSYAVGWNTSVFSIYERLLRLYGPGSVTTHLLAVPGDRSVDMIWQAQRAVQNKSGFVTVMIGGNDLCDHSGSYPSETLTPTSVANFSANLNQTFTILRTGLPASTVIALANVVNVSRLALYFSGNTQAATVYSQVCPALLSPSGIALLQSMQVQYNAAEVTIAHRFNLTLWDMGAFNFTSVDVNTLDYFHPSILGHQTIASLFWDALPYAKMLPGLSAPSVPSTVFQAGAVSVRVTAADVVPISTAAVYEAPGSTHWVSVPLAEVQGSAYNGTFAGTLPANATAASGILKLYLSANDTAGSTQTLPQGAPGAFYSINVTGVAPLTITSFALTPASDKVGEATNLSLVVTGGVPPYSYAYTGLPFGCVTTNSPTLSCVPAATGNFTLSAFVNDSSGRTARATAHLTVDPAGSSLASVAIDPSPVSLSPGAKVVLAAVPTCSGGLCPATGINYTWTLTNASLGSLSPLSGDYTVFAAGPAAGTVTVTLAGEYEGANRTSTTEVSINSSTASSKAPEILSFDAMPSTLTLGHSTTVAVSATGGTLPYSFAFAGLPPGCTPSDSPSFSCQPTTPGTYALAVTVADAQGATVNASAQLLVTSPSGYPVVSSFVGSPSHLSLGGSTVLSVAAFGGTGALSYRYAALPQGCASVNGSSLTCTPTETGSFSILVTVTDAAGHSAAATTEITVGSKPTSGAQSANSPIPIPALLFLGAVVLVVLAVLLFLRRRKSPPSRTPTVPAQRPAVEPWDEGALPERP